MGNLTKIEVSSEVIYQFKVPEKSLYVTHPSWDLEKENKITEDQRFVMGSGWSETYYLPLPWKIFKKSLESLAKRDCLEILPRFLTESIDYDASSQADSEYRYLLDSSGILIRLRNDGKMGVHTMSLIGNKESLIKIAEITSLPHPFDFKTYPYKKNFKDESGANGKILALT